MKILVTGGAGYLGSYLVPHLLNDGHQVTSFDTQWFGSGFLPEDTPLLTVIKSNICSEADILAACMGQDAVIHLACISAEAQCKIDPGFARKVNVGGAVTTARAALDAGVERFIFASSVAAYGSGDRDAEEGDDLLPTTIYGECKAYAEKRIKAIVPDAIIVRSASICGYSPHQRLDLTVNMMVHDAVRKQKITINGGQQKRSHITIRDATAFYKLLLETSMEKIAGQTFNAVAVNESINKTAEMVSDYMGVMRDWTPRTDNRSYTVDGAKAKSLLGWEPQYTLLSAVKDLKIRFDSGMWADSMTNELYQNVNRAIA